MTESLTVVFCSCSSLMLVNESVIKMVKRGKEASCGGRKKTHCEEFLFLLGMLPNLKTLIWCILPSLLHQTFAKKPIEKDERHHYGVFSSISYKGEC